MLVKESILVLQLEGCLSKNDLQYLFVVLIINNFTVLLDVFRSVWIYQQMWVKAHLRNREFGLTNPRVI